MPEIFHPARAQSIQSPEFAGSLKDTTEYCKALSTRYRSLVHEISSSKERTGMGYKEVLERTEELCGISRLAGHLTSHWLAMYRTRFS